MPAAQLLILMGTAGLLACIASLIALHILPSGYNAIRDPVSNYAVSRYGFLYRLQAFSSGICGVCLLGWFAASGAALPLWELLGWRCIRSRAWRLSSFPQTSGLRPPQTLKGTLHVILAACTFAGIAIATGILTPRLSDLAAWSRVSGNLAPRRRWTLSLKRQIMNAYGN